METNKEEISEELIECFNKLSRVVSDMEDICIKKKSDDIVIGFEMGKMYKEITNVGYKIMEINNKLNG